MNRKAMSGSATRPPRAIRRLVVAGLGAVLLASCAGLMVSGPAEAAKRRIRRAPITPAHVVTITIGSGTLTMTESSGKAGVMAFDLVNSSAVGHEIDIVRTDLAADKLPLKANGQFQERGVGVRVVKEAVKVGPSTHRGFTASLSAGAYVLADNLPGHYGKGERITFTVTA